MQHAWCILFLFYSNKSIDDYIDVNFSYLSGIALVYLPAYSPDLNPIEKLFGIFKNQMRQMQGLSHVQNDVADYLEYVLADIMTAQACHACYRGSGYV